MKTYTLALALILSGTSNVAIAQSNEQSNEQFSLDEIIVTARKRVESLQNAPLSVAAVSGQEMDKLGVTSLDQLSARTPGLQIGRGSQTAFIFIRGVGSGFNRGFEQSVGLYIDGVYQSRSLQFLQSMFDVQRVEVLRGPQGVLFGKNTIAGAVSITTNSPRIGDGFSGSLNALWEPKFNTFRYSAGVQGDLGETLAARVYYTGNRTDGFVDNVIRHENEKEARDHAGRLTLVWNPSDSLKINGKVSYSKSKGKGTAAVITAADYSLIPYFVSSGRTTSVVGSIILANGAFPGFGVSNGWTGFVDNPDFEPTDYLTNESTNAVLDAEWSFNSLTLSSITGFTKFKMYSNHDVDYTPVNMTHSVEYEDLQQFSQELRLASDWDGPFNFTVGGYFEHQRLKMDTENVLDGTAGGLIRPLIGGAPSLFHASVLAASNPAVAGLIKAGLLTPGTWIDYLTRRTTMDQKANTYALFGEMSYKVIDDVTLDVGIRYSHDKKSIDKDNIIGRGKPGRAVTLLNPTDTAGSADLNQLLMNAYKAGGPDAVLAQVVWAGLKTFPQKQSMSRAEDHLNVSARMRWQYNQDGMAYTSFSQGYKSGGFNAPPESANYAGDPIKGAEFKDETVNAFELGVKHSLLGDRIRLSGTLFHSKIKNLQVSAFDGVGFVVGNAAELKTQGAEFESQWRITRELELGLSVNYLDHKFTSFPGAPCSIAEIAKNASCTKDLSGKRGAYAPKWSGSFYADFIYPLTNNLNLNARTDVNHKSGMYFSNDLDPTLYQGGYVKIDGRIGISSSSNTWDVSVFGRNLTNRKTYTFAVDTALMGGIKAGYVEEPRTLGVQATFRF